MSGISFSTKATIQTPQSITSNFKETIPTLSAFLAMWSTVTEHAALNLQPLWKFPWHSFIFSFTFRRRNQCRGEVITENCYDRIINQTERHGVSIRVAPTALHILCCLRVLWGANIPEMAEPLRFCMLFSLVCGRYLQYHMKSQGNIEETKNISQ